MKNKIKEMVTCEGEIGRPHMPITFEGCFRALCPLCAEIEKAKAGEAAAEELREANEANETALELVKGLRADLKAADQFQKDTESQFRDQLEAAYKDRDEERQAYLDAAAKIEEAAALIEKALDADEDIEGEAAARQALKILKDGN